MKTTIKDTADKSTVSFEKFFDGEIRISVVQWQNGDRSPGMKSHVDVKLPSLLKALAGCL